MSHSGTPKGISCKNHAEIPFIKMNGLCSCGIKLTTGFYLILLTHRNSKFIKHDKICDICIYTNYVFWQCRCAIFSPTNIYTTNKINNAKITRLLMSLSCNKCEIQSKRNGFDLKENSLYIAFGFFFLKTSMAVIFALLEVMIITAIFDLHLFILC